MTARQTEPDPLAQAASSRRTGEIKRIAAERFHQSGYAATTMTDIAAAANILPGSLYHHFASKEDLAVSILTDLDTEIARLATESDMRLRAGEQPPDAALRALARDVTTLSMRNGAAIRLFSYAPPSVATSRFRAAVRLDAPKLERVWKRAVDDMCPAPRAAAQDTALLRSALHWLTLQSVVNTAGEPEDADTVARQLCDLLLGGLLTDCPPDDDLDHSTALAAARDAISTWRPTRVSDGSGSRDDIVAAATTLFAARGFDATTVRDIADAAGVRMGTLYRRIESKEDVLRQILGDYTAGIDSAVTAALTSSASVAESLDALAHVFVHGTRHFRTESYIVKYGWQQRNTTDGPLNDYYGQTRRRLHLLGSVLDRGIEHGSVRDLGTTTDIAIQIRSIIWLRYQDISRASALRTHRFLRNSLLRGFTTAS